MAELVVDGTYMTKAELAARWRIGTRGLDLRISLGKTPEPVRFSKRKTLFRTADVLQWESENNITVE